MESDFYHFVALLSLGVALAKPIRNIFKGWAHPEAIRAAVIVPEVKQELKVSVENSALDQKIIDMNERLFNK